MKEAPVPRYHLVPCPTWGGKGYTCYSNPGQPCGVGFGGSHRQRRLLWGAVAEAQSRGEIGVWWYGRFVQVQTPVSRNR